MLVNLNSVEKVTEFVATTSKFEEEIDLVSGRFVIDAKSLMGIFSLDLSKPMRVDVVGTEISETMRKQLQRFEVKSTRNTKC